MTQDERWHARYKQVLDFMRANGRRPSKHRVEDHLMLNWFKHNKKLYAKDMLSPERKALFVTLLAEADKYRRLNQYTVVDT